MDVMIQINKLFLLLFIFNLFFCKANDQKEAIFILGAPRSGTSAVTGVLQILGVDLGNNIRNYPLPWNAKGDFEDNAATEIDADILYDLNIDPYDKNLHLMKFNSFTLSLCQTNIKTMLKNNFSMFNRFAIKHPKMCLILPLYIQAAKELGYSIKLIIVLRNPKEIMQSNIANTNKLIREFTSQQEAINYLFNFWHAIYKYSIGYEKIFIKFDDFLNNTQAEVQKINDFLPNLKTYNETKDKIDDFLDKDLKHFNFLKIK